MNDLTTNEIFLHLNKVLNLLPGTIYVKDLQGFYLGCNQFQAKIAGFEYAEEIVGKTDYDLPWKDSAEIIRETDKRIMESGILEEIVEEGILHDNTQITMLSIKAPFYHSNGEVAGIVGTSIDITDRKKAEEREIAALKAVAAAEEARRKIEEDAKRIIMVLAGGIAHDLRTPLSSISMLNYNLKRSLPTCPDTDTHLTEFVTLIQNHLKKMDDYIAEMHIFIDDNLKAIKRSISTHIQTEDLIKCSSYKCIRDALESYPFKDGEKDLIEWDKTFYFDFQGNPILFLRILFNLISNALHQIKTNGKGKIYISAEELSTHNIIRFTDTAGGTTPEVADHIFDGYNTTKEEGTGVGLAFCKLMMESFGGGMECTLPTRDSIEFKLFFPKTSYNVNHINIKTKIA